MKITIFMLKHFMKTFIPTENKTFYFSSCETCEANCCNGKKGTMFAQIILDDFKKVYKNFPILFIKGELGYLKPVVLLTNGKEHCRYEKDFKCTIYDKRPSICQVYPLSVNIDEKYYIDENCPAVGEKGIKIIEKEKINPSFYDKILNNYKDKYIQTHFEFDPLNKEGNLDTLLINNMVFYKFKQDFKNSYINIHLQSLENLDTYYFHS